MIKKAKACVTIGKEVYAGRTKTEANENALAHLARFNDGNYSNPTVVSIVGTGLTGIVFRDADGYWVYTLHFPDQYTPSSRNVRAGIGGVHAGKFTRAQAENKMRYHMAQLSYGNPLNREEVLGMIPLEERAEMKGWLDFQEAYKRERDRGLSDEDARRALNPHL